MAKKKEKKEQDKKRLAKKKLELGVQAISDNIVYNATEQWAYYELANKAYDFLSNDGKISVAGQIINAFANIMSDRQDPIDCHLIIASTPVDVDAWEEQVRQASEDWDRGPGFDQFVAEQALYLRRQEYTKKVTYLGINLGKRGALNVDAASFVESGIKGATETVKEWLRIALKTPNEEISPTEEKDARRRENECYMILSTGNLQAQRCTAEDILLLIKRQFYPTMPAPYLDVDIENRVGPGDLELEVSSAIENKLRWLVINQMLNGTEYQGYRATLTISKLPKSVNFPYESMPFMYFLHKLALPFNCYARITLHPNSKMKAELEKKKKEQKDELDNLAAGGGTVDSQLGVMPTDVAEALSDMQLLTDMLAGGKMPWVEGTYRIVVETPTESALKKFCTMVQQKFADLDIKVQWSIGDQANLFLEQMPGDRLRVGAYKQITDLAFFGTSGFNYSSDVGDLIEKPDNIR